MSLPNLKLVALVQNHHSRAKFERKRDVNRLKVRATVLRRWLKEAAALQLQHAFQSRSLSYQPDE